MRKVLIILLFYLISIFLIGCTQISEDNDPNITDIKEKISNPTNDVEQKLIDAAEEQFNQIKSVDPDAIFSVDLQICSDKDNHRLYRMAVNGGFSGSDTYYDGSGKQFREDQWDDTYDPSVPEVDQTVQYVCEGDVLYSNSNDPSSS